MSSSCRAVWVALALFSGCRSAPKAVEVDLLIVGATAIDPGSGTAQRNSLVAIDEGEIVAYAGADEAGGYTAPEVLDANGQFLVPAFADMHTHWGNGTFYEDEEIVRTTLARSLYYGVTRILNLGSNDSSPEEIDGYRERLAKGKWHGPKIYATGALITVPGSHPTTTIFSPEVQDSIAARVASAPIAGPIDLNPIRAITLVRTPDDMRAEVRRLAEWGADAVKIVIESGPGNFGDDHPQMSASIVRAAVEEGRRAGIPVLAHISSPDELEVCLDQGVDAAAHAAEIYERAPEGTHERMGEAGFYYVATLNLYDGFVNWFGDPTRMDDPFLRETLRDEEAASMAYLFEEEGEEDPMDRSAMQLTFDHIRDAHLAGAILLTGSDVGNPFCFPGYAVHEELRLYVEAGVEPLDALAAASANAARFLGEEDTWGSIEVGHRADLLLLEGDPREDIANTRRIAHVIQSGKLVDRKALLAQP